MAFAAPTPLPLLFRTSLLHISPRLIHPLTLRMRRSCRRSPATAMSSPPPPLTLPDKTAFADTWSVFALRVPSKLCNGARNALRPHALTMSRVQSVLRPPPPPPSTPPHMHVLLRYFSSPPHSLFRHPPRGNADDAFVGCSRADVATMLRATEVPSKTSPEVLHFMRTVVEADIVERNLHIGYEQWTLDDVLRNLLPDGVTVPSSFETVGHIAHLNLREEHVAYKRLIGAVMLDKLAPRIKTVVNKLKSTDGPYRTFAMEVLAGDDSLEARLKENGCTFHLDFSKVYWNSRLESEHRKIIHSLKPDDVLADAFCGIGPFAIPAAKQKRCQRIYANDLNPSSIDYLRQNAKLNNIDQTTFQASCGCARSFLKRIVQKEEASITRVLMNFPSGAPEFLDIFRGLYAGREDRPPMPKVHCYCFVGGLDDFESARQRARHALFGRDISDEEAYDILPDSRIDVRDIRDVAPRKRQVCLTFIVPEEVAYNRLLPETEILSLPPPQKKIKSSA